MFLDFKDTLPFSWFYNLYSWIEKSICFTLRMYALAMRIYACLQKDRHLSQFDTIFY